jgi:two-component system cell cycle sensor histidine kinase/response regulator CckA
VQYALTHQAHDAHVVNIAGDQRTLGQRLTKAALAIQSAPNEGAYTARVGELRFVLSVWERIHLGLQNGDQQLDLPGHNSPDVKELFARMEPRYQALLIASKDLLAAAQADREAWPHVSDFSPLIQQILDEEEFYLNGMDDIVRQYDREAQARVVKLKTTEAVLLAVTLFALLLEGLFVFRPSARRVTEAFQGLAREIGERERAEEALRESEDRLRTVVAGAPIILFAVDRHGVFTLSQGKGLDSLGLQPGHLVGQSAYDTYRNVPELVKDIRRALGGQECRSVIVLEDLAFDTWCSPLRDPGGEVTGVIGVATDITERKRAEDALRTSEQDYRGLFEQAHDAILILDPDGEIVLDVNQRACQTYGFSRSEFIGKSMTEVARDKTRFTSRVHDTLERADTLQFDAVHYRRDGTEMHLEINAAAVNYNGKRAILSANRDITERKEAETALRTSEERFSKAFHGNPHVMTISTASDGRFVDVNDSFLRVFGFPKEEVLGRSVVDLGIYESVEDWGRTLAQLDDQGVANNLEIACRTKSGELRHLLISSERILAESEPYVISAAEDVTDLKRAEAERDAERRLLDALIDQLPVGVLFRDLDGLHTRANHAAASIIGIDQKSLGEMTAAEVVRLTHAAKPDGTPLTEDDIPPIVGAHQEHSVEPFDAVVTTMAGETRRVTISVAPVAFSGEEPFGSVLVVVDVTDQHAVQEQLRQSQKMESIGTLAGGVAHDFNNLLTVISGNVQLALRGFPPASPAVRRLAVIDGATKRAATLTRQLLAFSRRQQLERKRLNINDTIADIMKMLQRLIGEDIDVFIHPTSNLSLVLADPGQIEQVVMNLAINARDAMPGGGRLTLETHNVTLDEHYCRLHSGARIGKYIRIMLTDTGSGMDAQTQARIFEPFFTTKEVGKGTGLGLSTVYGIVKQHDGYVEVYSELGSGTTFKIYLPVAEGTVESEPVEIRPSISGGTETILVGEDDDNLRELARDILEECGYEVLLAKDGPEAFDLYRSLGDRVDLVVLDIMMPRLSGIEAYERMRAIRSDLPVIFMTGYSLESVQSRFPSTGGHESERPVIIQKPYALELLQRRVREVLDEAHTSSDRILAPS